MQEVTTPARWHASSAEDLRRLACIAATQAAGDLLQRGFDHAEADGANLVARSGKVNWRVSNRLTHRPGARAELLAGFDAAVVRALLTPLPTESPR